MKISIVLDPNPSRFMLDSLNSLYHSLEIANIEDFEVLIPTAKLTEKSANFFMHWKNTRLINLPSNSSRAHCWNVAFEHISSDSNLVLLFDMQIVLRENAVQRMLDMLEEDPLVGAVGPNLNVGNYIIQPIDIPENTSFDMFNKIADNFENTYIFRYALTMYLEGSCMMIRRSVLESVKNRNEMPCNEVFSHAFFDDIDLSMKILQCGFKLKIAATVACLIRESIPEGFWKVWEEDMHLFKSVWNFSPFYSGSIRYNIIDRIPEIRRAGMKILEVGCGVGGTLYAINDWNPTADLYGIEIDPGVSNFAKNFGKVFNDNVEKILPRGDENFDYIICGDVVEHLVNPWKALKNLQKMVKPGGHLIASIPNIMNIEVLEQVLHGRWDYKDAGILDRTHLRFFTLNSIKEMFEQADLKIEKVENTETHLTNEQKQLAKKLSEMFGTDENEFIAFQYIIDAVK